MTIFSTVLFFVCILCTTSISLPELHVIKKASFKYPYSCQPGPLSYEGCALFLTDYDVSHEPNLLYDGACGSDNYFEVSLAGDDFGLLSDLGDVPLENVTASKAFNYNDVASEDNQFTKSITVVKGHTYASLLARRDLRTLLVFRVDSYERSGPASISYAVKEYGVVQSVLEAPGFSWDEPNH